MVAATPGGKPLTSVAKKETGQFDCFVSLKTRDRRQYSSAADDAKDLVLLFK